MFINKFLKVTKNLNKYNYSVSNTTFIKIYSIFSYNKQFFSNARYSSELSRRFQRRKKGFPVRGQRTCSNGKTAKKKVWRKLQKK